VTATLPGRQTRPRSLRPRSTSIKHALPFPWDAGKHSCLQPLVLSALALAPGAGSRQWPKRGSHALLARLGINSLQALNRSDTTAELKKAMYGEGFPPNPQAAVELKGLAVGSAFPAVG